VTSRKKVSAKKAPVTKRKAATKSRRG
jgi:hypothetical protein